MFKYAYIDFLQEIAMHFIVGIILATVITTFIPADFFVNLGINQGIVAMLAMVLIGLPMYICSTSSIPIAMSLVAKGLSVGASFVFLFTGPVTNIASLIVLKKALGKKILTIYISIVVVMSIAFGFLLDYIVAMYSIDILNNANHISFMVVPHELKVVTAVLFAVLLVVCIAKNFISKKSNTSKSCSCH